MPRSSFDGATGRSRSTSSTRCILRPEGRGGLRAPGKQRVRRAAPPILSVRLVEHAALDVHPDGNLIVTIQGYPLRLGKVGADVAARVERVRTGLPLDAPAGDQA